MGKLKDRPNRNSGAATSAKKRRPIDQIILDIVSRIPEHEQNRLPRDLSENHDHYLYGAPKRTK